MKSFLSIKIISFLLLSISLVLNSCGKDDSPEPPPPLSSIKNINTFIFKSTDNPILTIDASGIIGQDTIKIILPHGTLLNNLVPSISFSGISVNPSDRVIQNFTMPVTYIVTAEDGTSKSYKVIATTESNKATIYIGSSPAGINPVGNIYAIDANTGSLIWRLAAQTHVSSMAFSNGLLYSGIRNKLTAFDTITRNVRWEYICGGTIFSSPTVANGVVYVNADNNTLYAIDASSGALKWSYAQEPDPIGGNWSSPTVIDGVVYFGSIDNYIYALNTATGVLKWRTYNPSGIVTRFHSSPCVVNGILYIGDSDHNLTALNITDGSVRWTYQTFGLIFSSPTVVNGIVYVATAQGLVYAIDAMTGALKWSYGTGDSIYGSPHVSGGIVFIGQDSDNGALYAIDAATGALKWRYDNDYTLFSSPVVFNNLVYVGSVGKLIAVDINTGLLRWKFLPTQSGESFPASPCIVDKQGNVYVSGISGNQN